jgi:hypothetical protein
MAGQKWRCLIMSRLVKMSLMAVALIVTTTPAYPEDRRFPVLSDLPVPEAFPNEFPLTLSNGWRR